MTASFIVTDKINHIMLYTSHWSSFELTTSVVISTDCIASCKFNYHMITATWRPLTTIRKIRKKKLTLKCLKTNIFASSDSPVSECISGGTTMDSSNPQNVYWQNTKWHRAGGRPLASWMRIWNMNRRTN